MNNQRIYLSSPHLSGEESVYVERAFATNWVAPLGPNVDAFEAQLAAYHGVSDAAALCSGTAAVHLALKAYGIQPGDLVFCSSLTFAASANPIAYEHAHPVFIDSDYSTWNMSVDALRRAMVWADAQHTLPRAVIVVDLYGQSAALEPIEEVCARYDVPVLEDAAEALGASYQGVKCGGRGHLSVLSFNGNKIITTSGGGALIGNDTGVIHKARYWATQARQPARHYEHTEIGYNYRMSNIVAGIGLGQLPVLDLRVQQKRAIFQRYVDGLGDLPGLAFMPEPDGYYSTRWLTVALLDTGVTDVTPTLIMDALEADNIESRPVWKPMHMQPVYAGAPYFSSQNGMDVSADLFTRGICLPSDTKMSEEDQQRVIRIIRGCWN